jgi:hypothetical protein
VFKDLSGGMKVAIYIITWIFVYLSAVTFVPMFAIFPEAGKAQSNIIVPFFLGVIGTLVGYYWGNSSKQKALKDTQADDYAKAEAMELEEKRIAEANKESERVEAERLRKAKEEAERVINEAQKKGEENVPTAKAV